MQGRKHDHTLDVNKTMSGANSGEIKEHNSDRVSRGRQGCGFDPRSDGHSGKLYVAGCWQVFTKKDVTRGSLWQKNKKIKRCFIYLICPDFFLSVFMLFLRSLFLPVAAGALPGLILPFRPTSSVLPIEKMRASIYYPVLVGQITASHFHSEISLRMHSLLRN